MAPEIERQTRVALIADYLDEGWPSMDLFADMLMARLPGARGGTITPDLVRPPFRRRFSRRGPHRSALGRAAFNLDRLVNRQLALPRRLRLLDPAPDVYHVLDHTYAHLVHSLPAERTVVTCHDLDAFRCVLEPERDPRPGWFRLLARRGLDGLRRAARVVCDSHAVAEELERSGALPGNRLCVVAPAAHPACTPDPDPAADSGAEALLGPRRPEAPEILHVGSVIPRKRIDRLLEIFAALRERHPGVRLVRVGGQLPASQRARAQALGVEGQLVELPFLTRDVLAAVYRRAAVTLLPSDAEGFGLPVLESLACGTPVVANDLPVLREVGGEAASYRDTGDLAGWAGLVSELLAERAGAGERWSTRRRASIERARSFTWDATARGVADVYRALAPVGAGVGVRQAVHP